MVSTPSDQAFTDCRTWAESTGHGPSQTKALEQACLFIGEQYADSPRHYGDTYRAHALAVSELLSSLRLDSQTLVAALLHDCPQAAPEAMSRVAERFGDPVARLVGGLEKMNQVESLGSGSGNSDSEGLRKLFLSIEEDIRAVLIKLAERTHDMRMLKHLDAVEERRRIAQETLDLYAPLANRLGIGQLKWELEDLSFRHLETETYQRIAGLLDERRIDREQFIDDFTGRLSTGLQEAGVGAEVYGRPKHIFSIWRKMLRKDVGFEHIYDVRAVRVLVDTLPQCYAALGIAHSLWQPIPGEFDDYIAKPKNNLYQSLHTAVYGPDGKVVEIQIRTRDMHEHAELGVAAHWRYKEGGPGDRDFEQRIHALRQALDLGDCADPEDFLDRIKDVLQYDTIHIFTPRGKVIDLPRGATALDFAYHIHTDVGHKCRGAKVNGRIIPLTQPLQNGQQVEILTSNSGHPRRDWLNPALGYLHTARARAKARLWFKQEHFDSNVAAGEAILERETRRLAVPTFDHEALAKRFNFQHLPDFLAALGRGDVLVDQVLRSIQGLVRPQRRKAATPAAGERPIGEFIKIQGIGGLVVHRAGCCNPRPGEPIVAVTTQSHGVTVHRRDCANLSGFSEDRLMEADWSTDERDNWRVSIGVQADDRKGLLRDISGLVSEFGLDIVVVHTESDRASGRADFRFTVEADTLDPIGPLLARLEDLPGVHSATRVAD